MSVNRAAAMALVVASSLSVLTMQLVASGPAAACEKHLNGHQNSSDTAPESTKK
jgi:hypothetical protein